ncbi:GMC family oxidoreductase [Brevibacillus choshinensis]|uniref:GMC family oxidoreductase n=1 Tax=Brevibacillus choshinensis TaxID=54911 RepID=UPI002E1ADAE2|nr:GMC family oxidoreductase [Brevibacillus choshinensis]
MYQSYDIIIIGTGAGGATLAHALKDSGAKVLLVERGDYLPREPENWDVKAVFSEKRYKPKESWYDDRGKPFSPGVHYVVGGNTKVYGAVLIRFREQDFEELVHEGGTSPEWPVTYSDFEPYYTKAEEHFFVHGKNGQDPTEPSRSKSFPFQEVPHEPTIEQLASKLRLQGLHPFYLPVGIDLREGGRCIRCKTCDGFPCKLEAKADAEVCGVTPTLESPDVELLTRTFARRILTDPSGRRAVAVELERDGERFEVRGETIVVSCGAVNSAALLLRSDSTAHPAGLANQSGLVGRNYMVHNSTFLMAVHPVWQNATTFQKTLSINDFYFGKRDFPYPMGNLQMLGKLQADMLKAQKAFVPKALLSYIADRSVDFYLTSEDLPDPENRVTVGRNGRIQIRWRPNNLEAHRQLVQETKRMLKRAGYPIILTQKMGIETNSHMCGTMRFGTDPVTSVLDPYCQAHTVQNLYVVDSSFFPSSAAVNPALTIAAQALRVADHILKER